MGIEAVHMERAKKDMIARQNLNIASKLDGLEPLY